MKKKRILLSLSLLSAAAFSLSACVKNADSSNTDLSPVESSSDNKTSLPTNANNQEGNDNSSLIPSINPTDGALDNSGTQTDENQPSQNLGNNETPNDPVNVVTQLDVTFDSGSTKNVVKIDKDNKVTKPDDPVKNGYTFNYWEYNGTEYDFNSPVVKSITLTARFTPIAGLTKLGFGDGYTEWTKLEEAVGTKENNGKIALKSVVTMNNIKFMSNGSNGVTGNGTTYATQKAEVKINMKSAGTIFVEGTWGSSSDGGCVYLKDSNGNEVYKSKSYPKNTTDSKSDISFSKEVPAGEYTLSSDKTITLSKLYYERVVTNVTLSFDTAGGNAINPITVEKYDVIENLPTPTYDNNIFLGWFIGQDSNTQFTEETKVTDNTTIYAKWKMYNPDDYATVSFDSGFANIEIDDVVVEKGKSLSSLPTLPTINNYRFDGWYSDSNFANKFTIDQKISSTCTLYANYVRVYDVTFMKKDGTVLSTTKVDEGTPVIDIPTNTFVLGYKFKYWSLTENGTEFQIASEDINSTTVLYPVYEETNTESINVIKYAGDQESLYGEFIGLENVEDYNIYVKNSLDSAYTKIDKQLLRLYKASGYNYYRFDAVGLKAGKYSFKIVPVLDGAESNENSYVMDNINVISYERTGFAFSKDSPLKGEAPGAYNNDGTLKNGALVIYVTEGNKKTVKATIAGAEYTGVPAITQAIKAKKTTQPIAIRIIGTVKGYTDMACADLSSAYAVGCKEATNVTIEGIGNDATLHGLGVAFFKCTSIEARNLGLMNWGGGKDGDGISIKESVNVWIHDNDVFYGDAGSDGDQAKGDGSMDLKDDTQYMTVSYMHFFDSGKMSLCGMKSESGPNYISYHHNWFDHSDSRHPRVRTMSVHVYNNYFDGNSKYGVGAAYDSDIFVEGNYFRNCKYPMLSSKSGTDALGEGTFSGENGGVIKAYDNYIEGASSLIYANAALGIQGATTDAVKDSFDAYLASTRDELVPASYKSTTGHSYNNFDTKVDLGVLAGQIQSPEEAKVTTMTYAGRVSGGDFKWEFDNAVDDASYALNQALKTAINNYSNGLIKVFGIDAQQPTSGEGQGSESGQGTGTEQGEGQSQGTESSVINSKNWTAKASENNTVVVDNSKIKIVASKFAKIEACGDYTGGKLDSGKTLVFTNKNASESLVVTIKVYVNDKSKVHSDSLGTANFLKVDSKQLVTYTVTIAAGGSYTITSGGQLYFVEASF